MGKEEWGWWGRRGGLRAVGRFVGFVVGLLRPWLDAVVALDLKGGGGRC